MPNNTMTFILDGNVLLSDYASALYHFNDLIDARATEFHAKNDVDWYIDELERSSARATIRGESQRQRPIDDVIAAYVNVGRALEANAPVPYSPSVSRSAKRIKEVINGHVTSIRFETADSDIIISHLNGPAAQPISIPSAYGVIEGRIQTLSNRGTLRFTLYDSLNDRAVSCYLDEGNEGWMLEAWGRRASVKGLIARDPESGRPITIRYISDIKLLPDGYANYRDARGAVPLPSDMPLPEEIIRRMRDGQ